MSTWPKYSMALSLPDSLKINKHYQVLIIEPPEIPEVFIFCSGYSGKYVIHTRKELGGN